MQCFCRRGADAKTKLKPAGQKLKAPPPDFTIKLKAQNKKPASNRLKRQANYGWEGFLRDAARHRHPWRARQYGVHAKRKGTSFPGLPLSKKMNISVN